MHRDREVAHLELPVQSSSLTAMIWILTADTNLSRAEGRSNSVAQLPEQNQMFRMEVTASARVRTIEAAKIPTQMTGVTIDEEEGAMVAAEASYLTTCYEAAMATTAADWVRCWNGKIVIGSGP